MEKLSERLARKDSQNHERQNTLSTGAPINDVLRIGEVCHRLSMARFEGLSGMYVLEESYAKALIRAVATGDTLLEVELVKSLGDLYLETGKAWRDVALLSKAIAMYNNARARCDDTDGKDVLIHRVKYTERVKGTVIRMRRGRGIYDHETVNSEEDPDGTYMLRTYTEHHRLGDRALRNGDVDLAERQFTSALKVVHGSGPAHLHKEAESLHKLGDVYLERGKVTKDGEDFTKAASLYNASMARIENRPFKRGSILAIKRTEESFLQHAIGVACVASPYELDLRHKTKLTGMRDKVKQQLDFIDEQNDPYKYGEDDPEVRKVESARAAAVRDLFQKTAKDRIAFLDNLVSECISIMGEPPCKYAFIGLGSQATELVTLFSDLEFAILLEEGCDSEENKMFFRNLTHYLHIKIINLGETILPAMAIKSLNDFYSEDPEDSWFYDSITTRGLAFDGAMPWASHTPLGRKQTENKPALELIQTPSQLARFQDAAVAMSEEDHLSDVLRSVCYVTGEETLVEQYRLKVMTTLKRNTAHANIEMANTEEFRNPELLSTLLNVKREIYRFPTIAVQNIALRCGIGTSSVWATIEELESGGHVSHENAHHLAVLVAISAELRLRTYMANGGQKENMSALLRFGNERNHRDKAVSDLEKVFYLPNQKMLYRYYYSAVPLRRALLELQRKNTVFSLSFALFETSAETKGEMNMKLCDFTSARKQFERALEKNKTIHGNGKDHPDIASCFRNLGWVCYSMGEYTDAEVFLQRALDMYLQIHGQGSTHPSIATSLRSLGAVASCL
ncbi:KLC1 [Branchiostoma lanceolatum]|uniref:KLC1 protein n=1 Tax=Branchiostoma lanceolatum TaxID=7740 RepID=A0A8J9W7X7_BRALA|nr:KLC1 [Branchiostoma lanceolatum]